MKKWNVPEVVELDVTCTENGKDPSPWETRFAFNNHDEKEQES